MCNTINKFASASYFLFYENFLFLLMKLNRYTVFQNTTR